MGNIRCCGSCSRLILPEDKEEWECMGTICFYELDRENGNNEQEEI